MSRADFVYVLTNPAMPGMVKVGMTQDSPRARAAALSAHTGVPSAFRVAWYAEVWDCVVLEDALKRALDRYRVNGRREFFSITVPEARQAIEHAAAGHLSRRFLPGPPDGFGGDAVPSGIEGLRWSAWPWFLPVAWWP